MDKKEVVCIQCNITQPQKNNEMLQFAMTWMELECIMLIKISQSEKDKYHVFTHMWNLIKQMNIGEKKRGKP